MRKKSTYGSDIAFSCMELLMARTVSLKSIGSSNQNRPCGGFLWHIVVIRGESLVRFA